MREKTAMKRRRKKVKDERRTANSSALALEGRESRQRAKARVEEMSPESSQVWG